MVLLGCTCKSAKLYNIHLITTDSTVCTDSVLRENTKNFNIIQSSLIADSLKYQGLKLNKTFWELRISKDCWYSASKSVWNKVFKFKFYCQDFTITNY